MDAMLRVNMTAQTINPETVKEEYKQLGGRGLIAKLMLDEVKPKCHPLGINSKLIFASGLLNGTIVSSAGRLSIGCKSPLTNGIKESNSGGIFANRMAQMGIKSIIIEGKPEHPTLYILIIYKNRFKLVNADEYQGKGVYETAGQILQSYPDAAIACIGPAGEKFYKSAGVAVTDSNGTPSRFCGRGGIGAVMGSKGIKAIIIPEKGKVDIYDTDNFKSSLNKYSDILKEAKSTKSYKNQGTAALVKRVYHLGGLPINNFSCDTSLDWNKISGETMINNIKNRGGEGKINHACMPGCLVQCSNVYVDKNGKTIVSPLEYETIALLGSNLGIWDLDSIAILNYECNDIGLDSIEIGNSLGVALEAGVASFGDYEAIHQLFKEIRQGTPLGRILGNGARTTGEVYGLVNVPEVKGQGFPGYDPRAIKGMGVTYATSAMGADHTAGPTARSEVQHESPEGQSELSKKMQVLLPLFDCTGLCLFTVGAVGPNPDLVLELINYRFGWKLDLDWLHKMSIETLRMEHLFNQQVGFATNNRLPEAFTERPLPNLGTVFDVPDDDLDRVITQLSG
ncbi:MAG: aldehyde ferredoxin oxidoreductase C-terminal domain-containing protein [Desulfovermiculus sp.]|nr:aldehyde ferredoxin oxidoreductase C-terminal domain-containing protein [Desulfovermiculus sp.]